MNKTELNSKTVTELKNIAQDLQIGGLSKKTKGAIIELILEKQPQETPKTQSSQEEIPTPLQLEKEEEKAVSNPDEALSQEEPATLPIQVEEKPKELEVQKDEPKEEVQSVQVPQVSQSVEQQKENTIQNNSNQQGQRRPQHNHQNQNRNNNQRNQQQRPNNNNNNQNQQKRNQEEGQDSNRFNNESTVEVSGILEIMSDGTHGVLRSPRLIPSDKDTYISISQVKKFRLRKGDFVTGTARLPKENERYFSLLWIKDVNGLTLDKIQNRPNFDEFKPVFPNKQIKLEIGQHPIANRVIDLLAPIGFGQRSMIVAQPKSGKTMLLKDIAHGINQNYPEVQLIVVLIGERPEEVTDIERSVNGIVYASNFDDSPNEQVMVAELSLERAKRMVEMGKDVVILMDSLTRLARAYNVALPASGRTLSGGLDPVSLYPSKRFFGAARNFENGASLTIVATSLVDTGSKMDEVIFEEFKGTGNMEVHLDRKLSNKRVFPAIDTLTSGTRNEDLLLGKDVLQSSWKIRRMIESLGNDANEALIDRFKSTKTNEDFLQTLHQY